MPTKTKEVPKKAKEDAPKIKGPACATCGKPVNLAGSHREDPRGSGNFRHMHECSAREFGENTLPVPPKTQSGVPAQKQAHLKRK